VLGFLCQPNLRAAGLFLPAVYGVSVPLGLAMTTPPCGWWNHNEKNLKTLFKVESIRALNSSGTPYGLRSFSLRGQRKLNQKKGHPCIEPAAPLVV